MHDRVGNLIDSVFLDDRAALPANGDSDPGEEQPQVIVNFRGRSDRRTRRSGGISLPDRDGGSDAVDFVDFGFFDPLEELAGIRGKRLDIPALAFRINRVKRQRRFARSADAGDDRQGVMRDFEVDVLEIVDPNAPNNDAVRPSEVRRCSHKPAIIQRRDAVYGCRSDSHLSGTCPAGLADKVLEIAGVIVTERTWPLFPSGFRACH